MAGPTKLAKKQIVTEVLGSFAVTTGILSALYQARNLWRFIDNNLSVLAAVLFLYVPAFLLWRRHSDLDRYGFTLSPLRRPLLFYLAAVAVVFPLFALGYQIYLHRVCGHLPAWLGPCGPLPRQHLRLPPQLLLTVVGQLFVVALPEEFFFRGFLQGRLSEAFSQPISVVLAALLFALGHLLVSLDPGSLAVFFPGLLFGLLRAATGSILAGTLFHASCNVLIDILHRSLG